MANIGNLIIHGVGGAGINIGADILMALEEYENISNVEMFSIDSTDKTIQKHSDLEETFLKIELETRRSRGLDGSGGERKNPKLVKHYQNSVKEYMDEFQLAKGSVTDFHFVIFSGSGGTGSVAGPLLVQELLQTDNIVVPVVVGDSSNLLFITNTINTLNTLENLARKNKTAMPVIYYNNTIDNTTNRSTEEEINDRVIKFMFLISTFLSGNVANIDLQDMRNFLQPTRYKTINIQSGIYELAVKRKELDVEDAIIARTLVDEEGDDIDIKISLMHNKVGQILDDNLLKDFGEQLPLYAFLRTNHLFEIIDELEETFEKIEETSKRKRRTLRSNVQNVEDDETGLVL